MHGLQARRSSRHGAVLALALAVGGAALAVAAEQARRVVRAHRRARAPVRRLARTGGRSGRRVLVLGDSTGVGVGCAAPDHPVPARLARAHPCATVLDLCVSGATVAGLHLQAREALSDAQASWDLVLVLAGGNDVLRRTPLPLLSAQVRSLLAMLAPRTRRIVWAGMANVGAAPMFLPPLSWWLSARARAVDRLLAHEVRAAGADYVGFFRERRDCPFAAEPRRYFAGDGVHPNGRAHARCWAGLRPAVARALTA